MITLKGITQKGKNRIREHGEFWTIARKQEKVSFSNELHWLFIFETFSNYSMWILEKNDPDFMIVANTEKE